MATLFSGFSPRCRASIRRGSSTPPDPLGDIYTKKKG